jgi:predicted nucleic acid-binding Zn ribbon protein
MEAKPTPVMSCPVCLYEYPTRDRFCVRDGAELMDGHSTGPSSQGMICPTCRRGYPFDSNFCPEDADELVPYGLYGAASSTRPPLRLDTNKICPECGIRHAAAHLFCGQDGTELVVVN